MNEPTRQPVYLFEGFRLDAQRRVLFGVDGEPIALTPRLFDALLYFVERAGQLLTKEQLLEAIWPNVVVEEHNLNKTVSELRRALGEKPGEHRFFVTKPGHGYRFVATVSLLVSSPGSARDAEPALGEGASRVVPEPAAAPAVLAPIQSGAPARRYWIAAVLGAVALAVGAGMLGFLGPSPTPPLRIAPWSADRNGQWWPVWSPDGSEVAFTTLSTATEPAKLMIRGLNEPVAREIARRPGRIPAITQWTTSGKILWWEREGLWSVSPVGAPPEVAVPLDFQSLGIYPPMATTTISRDGSMLATIRAGEDGSVGIWTAAPPSAKFERYEPAPFAAESYSDAPSLRFSPDGTQLMFVWYATSRGEEAWLLPIPPDPNNPPRRVLEDMPLAGGTATFSWFPDNRHVAMSTGEGGERRLYVADTRSGEFRLLSSGLGNLNAPAVSPDGSKLMFVDNRSHLDIVTLDVDTAKVTDLIATDRSEMSPTWARTSDTLVYLTDLNGSGWEIWLQEPAKPARPLVTAAHFEKGSTLYLIAPTLSPDGKFVIFDRVEAPVNRTRLWMSAVNGGKPVLVTNEDILEFAGSWSPDGSWYAYLAETKAGSRTLKKVRTNGSATPETLIEDLPIVGGDSFVPLWSPDGEWLLVPNEQMMLVSPDGKMTRKLGIEPSPCAFAADEPLLYCILDWRPSPDHPFVAVDFNGEIVREIASVSRADMPVAGFTPGLRLSLTPDGSGVTFSVGKTSQNLWLMEGLDTVPLP